MNSLENILIEVKNEPSASAMNSLHSLISKINNIADEQELVNIYQTFDVAENIHTALQPQIAQLKKIVVQKMRALLYSISQGMKIVNLGAVPDRHSKMEKLFTHATGEKF
ncbi:MAG: hypothetical protein NUV82_01815 [Candidatus Komeilibacteria bacterium]|nr:hypothetical protein [Candidatus Komeilibacteria bacterium]